MDWLVAFDEAGLFVVGAVLFASLCIALFLGIASERRTGGRQRGDRR